MAKVYMLRHQKAGILTSHVFLRPPTKEQMEPLVEECERLHGKSGWVAVHEAELMDAEVPAFPKRERGAENAAAVGQFGAHGEGMVINPEDVGTIDAAALLGKEPR